MSNGDPSYLLQEDGFRLELEDGTGFLILEEPLPLGVWVEQDEATGIWVEQP